MSQGIAPTDFIDQNFYSMNSRRLDFRLATLRCLDLAGDDDDRFAFEPLAPTDHGLADGAFPNSDHALNGDHSLTQHNEGNLLACPLVMSYVRREAEGSQADSSV